jgi:hypothetical protein
MNRFAFPNLEAKPSLSRAAADGSSSPVADEYLACHVDRTSIAPRQVRLLAKATRAQPWTQQVKKTRSRI